MIYLFYLIYVCIYFLYVVRLTRSILHRNDGSIEINRLDYTMNKKQTDKELNGNQFEDKTAIVLQPTLIRNNI